MGGLPEKHREHHRDVLLAMGAARQYAGPRGLTVEEIEAAWRDVPDRGASEKEAGEIFGYDFGAGKRGGRRAAGVRQGSARYGSGAGGAPGRSRSAPRDPFGSGATNGFGRHSRTPLWEGQATYTIEGDAPFPLISPVSSVNISGCELDCRSSMLGTDANCAGLASSVASEITEEALERLASADRVFRLSPFSASISDEEKEFLTAAWGVLVGNMDLIDWAICHATGTSTGSETAALKRMLTGEDSTAIVVISTELGGIAMALSLLGRNIWIAQGNPHWGRWLDKWASTDHSVRLCGLLDFAAVLLHELCHLAGFTLMDLDDTVCYDVYMIGSAFAWALFFRFPDAAAATCCKRFTAADAFGCGELVEAQVGCGEGDHPPFPATIEDSWAAIWSDVAAGVGEIGDWLEDNFTFGGKGGGGRVWDLNFCTTCPWLCSGMAPKRTGGTEEDWARCLEAMADDLVEEDPAFELAESGW